MVCLAAPCAAPKPINLDECILCQKKKRVEYLSSGENGKRNIVLLAKQTESDDTRVTRVLQLTAQEQGTIKYHASSCYRNFQRDMAKIDSIMQPLEQPEPTQQVVAVNDMPEPRSKRFKPSVPANICIICGSDRLTLKRKTIHSLYRICEKPMAQKLLNAAMLFKDHVYTETASMCNVGDVFAADIHYHDNCCKAYFRKYHSKIEEVMSNLEIEESVAAGDDSLKARFLALELDFSKSAYSLTSIRDQLNKGDSTEIVSNRVVKHLIIELYGDAVCFTYPSNKRMSQMVFCTKSSPEALIESLRVPPIQQVATELAQELKEYSFELQKSFCEPQDLKISMNLFSKNPPPTWTEFCSYLFKGKTTSQLKTDVVFQILNYILTDGKDPTPFHVMVAQAVHGLTRSKELVTMLNQHGICVSYNTIKRMNRCGPC